MSDNKKTKAVLLLEDGKVYEGFSGGTNSKNKSFGRVVFNTGMVGYQQQLTDPANYGLIIVQTFPLIGNYGVNSKNGYTTDAVHAAGYVVRELCDEPSNYLCEGTLPDFLDKNSVAAITGVDTRSITRHIRENGEMKGVIAIGEVNLDELKKELSAWTPAPCKFESSSGSVGNIGGESSRCKLAVLDMGAGFDFYATLCNMSAGINKFSPDTSADGILSNNPDGIVISNGGGNPADFKKAIETIKELSKTGIPMLGVGLGHLLLALAMGGEIEAMHCGHRGANQPVYRNANGRTYITSQNHGFVASSGKLPEGAEISYKNSNDKTVEGFIYNGINAQSVQFMPDTTKGTQSTRFIYEDFIAQVLARKGK